MSDLDLKTRATTLLNFLARSRPLHIFLLTAGLCLLFQRCLTLEQQGAGTVGFAMDDAWIHAAVARNFVEGSGWSIVPGRTLSVSTSPTWTLLVAASFFVVRDPVISVLLLSLLLMVGATVLFYLLVERFTGRPWLALAGGGLFFLNPIAIWGLASGMELPLVLLALLAVLAGYYFSEPVSRARLVLVPLLLAFAAVTRPELFLLIPIAILDTFYSIWVSGREDAKPRAFRTAVVQGALVLAALSPYFIFNLAAGGRLFPSTYYAKTLVRGVGLSAALQSKNWGEMHRALVTDPLAQVSDLSRTLFAHNPAAFLLFVPGLLLFCKAFANQYTARGNLLAFSVFVIPWFMGMTSPTRALSNHADRYYVIFPPLVLLLSLLAVDFLLRRAKLVLVPILCVVLMVLAPWRTTPGAIAYLVKDVDSTERLYHQMGVWVRDNLDPGARLATNDIGGVAYFAPRDLIDVMGLASPEIWPVLWRAPGEPQDVNKLRDYFRQEKIEYLIASPRYYPAITRDSRVFQPVMKWQEDPKRSTGRTISPQVLYKVEWDKEQRPTRGAGGGGPAPG